MVEIERRNSRPISCKLYTLNSHTVLERLFEQEALQMKLHMPDSEIAMRYRNAEDPQDAIKILAQLNAAGPSDILAALARTGIQVDAPQRGSRAKKRTSHGVKNKKRQFIDEAKARELYGRGLNDGEIGRRLGALPSTICNWRRRNGLKANTTVGFQRAKKKNPPHDGNRGAEKS